MKILHVVPTYFPASRYGGTLWSVHGLCAALAGRGHEVHVWTTNVDGPEDLDVPLEIDVPLDGVRVRYFRSVLLRRLYWSPGMSKAFRNLKGFDLLHLHSIFLWPTWAAARAAQKESVPYLVSPRGMLVKELVARKNKWLKNAWFSCVGRPFLERAAAICFTSRIEAIEAEKFSLRFQKTFVIPNGTDGGCAKKISEAGASLPLAETERIAAAGPYLLFLGRVNWKKGLDRLIQALVRVPDALLVIAGNDEENYQSVLESLAEKSKVRSRVIFTGPVYGAAKEALMKNARLFVMPSYSENFGNSALEAMAAGCAVVVTPEVGLSEIIGPAGAGFVTAGDPESLGRDLNRFLSDPLLIKKMGETGRDLVREKYSWDAVALAMEKAYQEITERPGPC